MNYEEYVSELVANGAISKAEFERAVGIIKSQTYPQTFDTLDDLLKQVGFTEGHRVIVMMLLMPEGQDEAFTYNDQGDIFLSPNFDTIVEKISELLA